MKTTTVSFSNYFKKEEVMLMLDCSTDDYNQTLRIRVPNCKKFCYFDVEEIDHPLWSHKSNNLFFNDEPEFLDDYRDNALNLLKKITTDLLSCSVTTNDDLFLRLSRPFMFPFFDLKEHLILMPNKEFELITAWRGNNVNDYRDEMNGILERFIDDDDQDLNSMPEVIPSMYLLMDDMEIDSTPYNALRKIRLSHDPDDPKRARVEVMKAMWDHDWDNFFSFYSKIPKNDHDWDPVPKYFLTLAINEYFDDWDAVVNSVNELSYFGGIPNFIIYSLKGCWEFERGEFELALASKLEAFKCELGREYIAIQLSVIYNKLMMFDKVLPLFSVDILRNLQDLRTMEDIDTAMTQVCIAIAELNNDSAKSNFEELIAENNLFAVKGAYYKAKDKYSTLLKSQTPIERALEGCMGRSKNSFAYS